MTPSLREDLPGADLEELEYAAMRRAADASLALLAADPAAPSRRVVLAVDVLPAWVRAGLDDGPAGVRIDSVIPSSRLVSVHVDDPAAEPDVRAAVLALPGGPGGLQDPVEDLLEDHELLWYAAMELPDLLGLRGSMRA